MIETHSGGCQCGAVRFRLKGALSDASICHCRMCQKAFGAWGAALVNAPSDQLEWTRGKPSVFRSSSIVDRGFCAACGTPLYMREDGDTNYEMAIGAFDDPNDMPPLSRQSAIESKVHWFDAMRDLPTERMDDYRTPEDMVKLKSFQHPDHDTAEWPLEQKT
jgi:hypothetical protein